MNYRPCANLIRVSPNTKEGTDILRKPNEKPDQHECQKERNAPIPIQRPKDHGRPRVKSQCAGCDIPSIVTDVMMRKEIRINRKRIQSRHPIGRMMPNSDVQQSPRLDDIATHRRIHKTGKERNPQDLRVGKVRVGPRPNSRRSLEHLEKRQIALNSSTVSSFAQTIHPWIIKAITKRTSYRGSPHSPLRGTENTAVKNSTTNKHARASPK